MPPTTRMSPLKTAWKGLLFTSLQILWVSQFIAFVDRNIYLTVWVIISHLVENFDTRKHRTGLIMPTTIRQWRSLTILPAFFSFVLQDVNMQRPVKQCFNPQQRKSDITVFDRYLCPMSKTFKHSSTINQLNATRKLVLCGSRDVGWHDSLESSQQT